MTLRRITRDRPLAPEEAAKYRKVREQIAQELPELIVRHEGAPEKVKMSGRAKGGLNRP